MRKNIILVIIVILSIAVGLLLLGSFPFNGEYDPEPKAISIWDDGNSFASGLKVNTPYQKDGIVYIRMQEEKNIYVTTPLCTGSMKPTFHCNTYLIMFKPTKEEDIKLGDIIVFSRGASDIVHRVIRIGELNDRKYYWTKGDANSDEDPESFTFNRIKYKVTGLWYT